MIHKEGIQISISIFIFLIALNALIYYLSKGNLHVTVPFLTASLVFFALILWFFRVPQREMIVDNKKIYAPADGVLVVIEETEETEYFKDRRIQVSIFMSPLNVHVNYYPVSGKVKYYKYHPGKYFVAWHPKSSLLNERSTVVVETSDGKEILIRQIAGAVARRIVTYAEEQMDVEQGKEMGFIKFGSRVDLFLPLGTKIKAGLNQKSKATQTVIAEF